MNRGEQPSDEQNVLHVENDEQRIQKSPTATSMVSGPVKSDTTEKSIGGATVRSGTSSRRSSRGACRAARWCQEMRGAP